jgi:ribosomal protein S18 acetylase RimI-like enzyme
MNLTLTAAPTTTGQARPLNILRDLPAVADLVELCFEDSMDSSGRSHLNEMRRHGHDNVFLSWAPHVVDVISLPLSGFVWEADGKVVGNASLIPFHSFGKRIYLIANVATHPNYRRRGIGRMLTEMAMERAREKGASSLWLHVRADNPGAIKIYHDLGFVERMRRTEWYAPSRTMNRIGNDPAFKIRARAARDWTQQRTWLERAYPEEMNWYQRQQSWSAFGPSLWRKIYRILVDIDVSQYTVEAGNGLRGVVSCRYEGGKSPHIWLACPPNPDETALTELLFYARRMFSNLGGLHLEYPVGPADQAVQAAGFEPKRTLLWMQAPGQQPN